MHVRKLSWAAVGAAFTEAETALAALDAHIARIGADHFPDTTHERLALAREALTTSRHALDSDDWPRAINRAREAFAESEAVRAGITFASLAPERLGFECATNTISPRFRVRRAYDIGRINLSSGTR
jgi:hypothetical protein